MTTESTVARVIECSLRFVGSWPDVRYALFCRCVWIFIILIVQICQYWYIFIHVKTDEMSELMDGLSVALEYTVMLVKLIILWLNNRIFYNVLATMATDWRDATINGMQIMMSKANLARYLSNMIIGLHISSTVCFGIGTVLSYIFVNAAETPTREFIVKLQLPLECSESPLYEIVSFLLFLHLLAAAIINGTLNSLIVTLVLHASGQIDILCQGLREISPEKCNQRLAVSLASQLITKHQKIIVFSKEIGDIFCYMALIQFMSSTLVICCLGLILMTSISTMSESDAMDSSALMKTLVFYIGATSEAFVFCICGEYLGTKNKMIGDAAYKSFWYDLNANDSKLLLLIILRSQRKLTITAGKVMDLSLEAFATIIKGSVSYMSVLHAMY